MAITNQDRVGKAMDLLRQGLAPFVEREVQEKVRIGTVNMDTVRRFSEDPALAKRPILEWDIAALLKLMVAAWRDVFGTTLGRSDLSLAQELRDWRNKWAHQERFTSRDAERALDSASRLLTAISAPQAEEIDKIMQELRRLTFEEQVRNEKKKVGGSLIESAAAGSLKPWRDVVTPHADVASGRYQQAEFAADLWQVHIGQGSAEYNNPKEFFRRTYLTESLKRLLVSAVRRVSGQGGDPVVQLQTNFGGGKTHSMLALYHLFSSTPIAEMAGADAVMAEAGAKSLPKVKRVVLVGNKISPGNPATKSDGTVVRTLWGELAWQLGGKKAFSRIAKDDERATSPGDVLRELFVEYGPCLILDQKQLLRELAAVAEQSATGTDAERQEVADAIRKSLHRLTLRQGVFRLLDRLGLQHLKQPWDALYAERSTLVHGLAPQPGADYGDLAHRTVSLCGQILLKAAAAEISQADRHVTKMYVG